MNGTSSDLNGAIEAAPRPHFRRNSATTESRAGYVVAAGCLLGIRPKCSKPSKMPPAQWAWAK